DPPVLAWNGSRFGLLWSASMHLPTGQSTASLRFALLDAAGTKIRGDVPVLTGDRSTSLVVHSDVRPPMVWGGAGWGVFTLQRQAAALDELVYYRLAENGTRLVGPVTLTSDAVWQIDFTAASRGAEYGLAWIDHVDNAFTVKFQRLQPNGALLGSPTSVWTNLPGHDASYTSVAWDGTAWAVAFVAGTDTGGEGVYLARLDALGNLVGPPQRLSADGDVGESFPVLTVKPGGGYVVYVEDSSLGDEIVRLEAD